MSEERAVNYIHDTLRAEDPTHGAVAPPRDERKADVHYTLELGKVICARIAGGEPLNRICRDDDMPHRSQVYRWLLDNDKLEFKVMYDVAKDMQADSLVDEILEIADDSSADWKDIETRGGNSIRIVDNEAVQRSKLRVDARKWLAGVMKPRKYGDKTQIEVGSDPNKPVVVVDRIELVIPSVSAKHIIEHDGDTPD